MIYNRLQIKFPQIVSMCILIIFRSSDLLEIIINYIFDIIDVLLGISKPRLEI